MDFNKRLAAAYPEIFGEPGGGASTEGTDRESQYHQKWGSYEELYCLAQGDFTRFDEVSSYSVHECYLYLAHNKEKHDHNLYLAKKR